MGAAVVEFHAFTDNNNRFIVKELAVVGDSYRCQVIFKPPYSIDQLNSKVRRTTRWLSRHYHGIPWDEGSVPYNESLITALCIPFKSIYTKGREKAEFLRQFHPNVREVDGPTIVDAQKSNICLLDHEKCALRSACTLHHYLSSVTDEIDQFNLNHGERLVTVVPRAERARRGSNRQIHNEVW